MPVHGGANCLLAPINFFDHKNAKNDTKVISTDKAFAGRNPDILYKVVARRNPDQLKAEAHPLTVDDLTMTVTDCNYSAGLKRERRLGKDLNLERRVDHWLRHSEASDKKIEDKK